VVNDLAIGHPDDLPFGCYVADFLAITHGPGLVQHFFAAIRQVFTAICQRPFEVIHELGVVVYLHLLVGVVGEIQAVRGDRHGYPARQFGDMGDQPLDGHAFGVWLPGEIRGRDPFEHLARSLGFLVHFF